jgi:hypothetical protein
MQEKGALFGAPGQGAAFGRSTAFGDGCNPIRKHKKAVELDNPGSYDFLDYQSKAFECARGRTAKCIVVSILSLWMNLQTFKTQFGKHCVPN